MNCHKSVGITTNTSVLVQGLVSNFIAAGHGREAAFAAAVLGDNALMEKAWQDTGMLAEAVLHSQVSSFHALPIPCSETWNIRVSTFAE